MHFLKGYQYIFKQTTQYTSHYNFAIIQMNKADFQITHIQTLIFT